MSLPSDASSVTTGLLAAFAILVIFIRSKNWLDSNVPLYFYFLMLIYTRAVDSRVPFLLIMIGLGLTLLLRFEFMNNFMIQAIKYMEMTALAAIVYLCFKTVTA
jgi:hypothetical protein